jgi:hypothetical protein
MPSKRRHPLQNIKGVKEGIAIFLFFWVSGINN